MLAEMSPENSTATTPNVVPDKLNGDNDAKLVTQARSGSMTAMEELVARYESRLVRLAQKITGNHEDAEEVVQNAFVKGFQNLSAFRGDSRFGTWIVRIAVNEALMRIRGKRFMEVPIDHADCADDRIIPAELQDSGPSPEEQYSRDELQRIFETTVSQLDPGYRIVFQLRDIEGFSTEETARTLDLSLSAVKSRLQRHDSDCAICWTFICGFPPGSAASARQP